MSLQDKIKNVEETMWPLTMGMSIEEWKLNERKEEYLRIGDIIERFNHIDELYNHTPWTLEQIYSNLNILVGKVVEDGNDN